jgi:hypothetical protein
MKRRAWMFSVVILLVSSFALKAQDIASQGTAAPVPRLMRFSGTALDADGKPLSGVVGITFALYSEQTGGAALWLETQNVQADAGGHYRALLGGTKPDGLPTDMFTSGEARWLGVQISGQAEQPRVLLLSVPYALKAGDAETVGGLPASAFVLANSAQGTATSTKSGAAPASTAATKNAVTPANPAVTGKGVVDYIPMWDTTSDIVDSLIFQKSSQIGIGTTAPAATLDVNGKGDIRDTLTLFPKGTDATLAINGTTFKIDQTGKMTFISGQTFPGTGTITGITTASGSGLSGGGTTGTLSLKVPAAGITNTMLQHPSLTLTAGGGMTGGGSVSLGGTTTLGLKTCSANQVLQYVSGAWTCSNAGTGSITGVTAGTDLTGGGTSGTVTLNLDTTKVPQLNAANTFTGNQTITGNSTTQILNITQSGNGAGILANSQSGIAVEGINNSPSGFLNFGVAGKASGTGGIGVGGVASSAAGSTIGVYGQSASTSGTGVEGSETATTGTTYGVYGATASPSGYGVYGTSGSSGTGVYGSSSSGTGVSGNSTSGDAVTGISGYDGGYFRGTNFGSYSENDTDGNFYVAALAQEFGSTQETFGLWGYSASEIGVGTYGEAVSSSSEGNAVGGHSPVGVWGDSGAAGGIGVQGTADDGWAFYGVNNSPSGYPAAFFSTRESSSASFPVLQTIGGHYGGECVIDVSGNLKCTGVVTAVVPAGGGSRKVALNTISSPEHWFEDAGSGQLSNGEAVINIEAVFGETVNTGVDYHVFLTPNGDCKGLYVTRKSPTSFVVRELSGGTSNIAFDYRIMAKRKGFEEFRLVDKTADMNAPRPKRAVGTRPPMPKPQDIRKAQEARLNAAHLVRPGLKAK